jgi:hypothetical protein
MFTRLESISSNLTIVFVKCEQQFQPAKTVVLGFTPSKTPTVAIRPVLTLKTWYFNLSILAQNQYLSSDHIMP